LYVLEFKCTSDQRRNYRERGEARARAQHDVLVKSLEKVAGEAVGENSGWKIKLLNIGMLARCNLSPYLYNIDNLLDLFV
jgi:hypothetical protein